MLNHFHTYLLNRPAEFFKDSLFPVYVPDEFTPSPWDEFTEQIDKTLFGDSPDASLLDYRFFQFMHVIGGSHLADLVRRFDSRETYIHDRTAFYDETNFLTKITPEHGISFTDTRDRQAQHLRRHFSVIVPSSQNMTPMVFLNSERSQPLEAVPVSGQEVANRFHVESLGLMVNVTQPGTWTVDYRARPARRLEHVIIDTLDLSSGIFHKLFEFVRPIAPEYEEGFRTITDSLTRFCLILFAQAIANEQMKKVWETSPRFPSRR